MTCKVIIPANEQEVFLYNAILPVNISDAYRFVIQPEHLEKANHV